MISAFGEILLYLIIGVVFVLGGLLTAQIIRPNRPNEQKLSTYESGEDAIGSAWGKFNTRFYIIALIFLLFDVEIVFIFPWATVFGRKELIEQTEGLWAWFAFFEMVVFILILILGLAYAWAKGHLDWIKIPSSTKDFESPVPADLYKDFNKKYQIKSK
jgi:NADH-quinone oxidoreductase subunit A